jgi:hypothetical protein
MTKKTVLHSYFPLIKHHQLPTISRRTQAAGLDSSTTPTSGSMTTEEIMQMFAALEENQTRLTEALEVIQNSQRELASIAQRPIHIETTSSGQVIAGGASTKEISDKPTKFTGKWDNYRTFDAGFENYLEINPNVYNTEAMKARLLFGLLDGPTKAWATKFVPEFQSKDFRFENFFSQFKALYGAQNFGRQAFR